MKQAAKNEIIISNMYKKHLRRQSFAVPTPTFSDTSHKKPEDNHRRKKSSQSNPWSIC